MQVRDGMSSSVLTIGPDHTMREAARRMSARHVGAAVVLDADSSIGILTERDVLVSIGDGQDPDTERGRRPPHPETWCSPRRTGRSRLPRKRWCGAASGISWSSTPARSPG